MLKLYLVAWMVSSGLIVCTTGSVFGQNYPTRPIRIATSPPGGGTDFIARLIAQELAGPLGQPVVVENRTGIASIETVTKAPPDGYTLLVYSDGLWIFPLIQKVSYDPVKDISPISSVGNSPNVLVVHPSLPVKSVKELIALAKARPGVLNYATGGPTSTGVLTTGLFNSMAGTKMVAINYSGNGPAVIAVISGEVDLLFSSASAVTPHIKSGRLRGLAVSSAQPSALVPGLPTVAASGLPGFETGLTYGVYAPGRTPAAIITQLNRAVVSVLSNKEARAKLLEIGVEVFTSSPEQLAATISLEMTRMGKVIKDAGLGPK